MIKPKEFEILVSSVQEAVKFYTEKLSFDIVNLDINQEELQAVRLRKGKCVLTFKRPNVQESVDFSFIKRCPSRCLALSIEVTKELSSMLQKYTKKDVTILDQQEVDGILTSFSIKDPFGVKLHFFQEPKASQKPTPSPTFLEKELESPLKGKRVIAKSSQDRIINKTIEKLQSYGIVRRAAKKFCKNQLKTIGRR